MEDGHRIRTGTAVPDVKVARAAQEAAIAGLSFMRGIPGGIGGALRMNGGAYGRETKDALIEARGVDRQGNIRVFSNADMHYTLPALRRAGRRHFHAGVVSGLGRRQGRDRRRDGQDHRSARGDAADQEPHRRLNLQEPARPQGLAIDRRRRLPRPAQRRRAGVRIALQFPDQSRQRVGRADRSARRNRARARESEFRRDAGMGNQADRRRGFSEVARFKNNGRD